MEEKKIKVKPPYISDETRNAIGAFLARTSAPRIIAKRLENQKRKELKEEQGA